MKCKMLWRQETYAHRVAVCVSVKQLATFYVVVSERRALRLRGRDQGSGAYGKKKLRSTNST